MSKLSAAATNIARIEASGRKDVRRRLRLIFKEAESIPHPTYAWAQLTDAERRSLIAYLADDSERPRPTSPGAIVRPAFTITFPRRAQRVIWALLTD